MSDAAQQPGGDPAGPEMSAEEAEFQAAYEEQLRRVTANELLLQAAASLLNLGARRMGLREEDAADRDLEQVRDAIDGVRGLLPVIERRGDAAQTRPLRDALSHLQVAYARELQTTAAATTAQGGAGDSGSSSEAGRTPGEGEPEGAAGAPRPAGPGAGEESGSSEDRGPEDAEGSSAPRSEEPVEPRRPGPAESSGRLWVPGKD
jgi:hypothetical protein